MVNQLTQTAMDQQTISVIDDDRAILDSLAWLLESQGYSVKVYDSASAYLESYHDAMTGCILLDIQMPVMNGLELQKALIERDCTLPIIFLSGQSEVPVVGVAIRYGGFEFFEKPFDEDLLLDRIRDAVAIEQQSRNSPSDRQGIIRRIKRLTKQEKCIMQQVALGSTSKQIAQELGLSHKTVEVYRSRVMQKMCVSSLPVLVRLLIENGLG